MNKIYDNGALMLGNIDLVIKEVQKEKDKYINMCCIDIDELLIDIDELLKDLIDIKNDCKDVDIVMINYNNGMGYSIDYWYKNDIVESEED